MKLKFLIVLILGLLFESTYAQTSCPSTSNLPFEWPSHRNWFVAPNLFNGAIINTQTWAVTNIGDAWNPVSSYEGVTSASDDEGNLLFYSNGRRLWTGTTPQLEFAGLLEGNENGGTGNNGSASQGIITVRHPLNPDVYHIFTTGDALSGNVGFNHFTFDAQGNQLSGPTRLGGYRTTEGVAATKHANGVDIWVSSMDVTGNFNMYLLTCDGIDLANSNLNQGLAPNVTGNSNWERGGLAFSYDGEMFAQCHGNGWPNGDQKTSVYDFDNETGAVTNARDIADAGVVYGVYDLTFSPDNSRLFVSRSNSTLIYYDVTLGGEAAISASVQNTGINLAFSAIEIAADGNLYLAHGVAGAGPLRRVNGNLNTGAAFTTSNVAGTNGLVHLGLPTMYLPPQEQPITEEEDDLCTTDAPIDLNTTWWCSGLDAEDDVRNPNAYSGLGITDAAFGIFDPSVAGEGTHQIIFNYCAVSDTIEITVVSCEDCEVEVDDVNPEICVGETFNLDPTVLNASANGVWSIDSTPGGIDPVISITAGDTIFDALNLLTTDGVYKLLYTVDDAGEICYDSLYITVNPLPNPDLGIDQEICEGDAAVTLDGGTFDSYLWSTGATSPTIDVSTTDEYILTVTDVNGCEGSDTMNLTVNPLPTPDLGIDQEICEGDAAVTLDGGTFDSYLWSTGATSPTIDVSTTDEYILTVTDVNGCEGSDTMNLMVNPLPAPDLGADQVICEGDAAVTLDGGLFDSYLWSTGATSPTIDVSTTDEYILTVTDVNGCEGSDTMNLTVNPLPTPDLGIDQEICEGDAAVTLDGGTFDSYLWSTGATSPTIDVSTTDEYILTVTDVNGCEGSDTMNLTVNPLPTPDLGIDQEICEGDAAVTLDGGTFDSYLWSTGATSPTIDVSTTDEYILTVTDVNGCEGSDTMNLTVNPLPTPDLGIDQEICEGDAAVTLDGGLFDSYLWSTGATTPTIDVLTTDEYILNVADVNGCEGSDTMNLTVNPLPTPDLGIDQEICEGDAAVTLDGGTFDSYLWSTGATSPTIDVSTTDEYILTVTDVNGCEGSDTMNLMVNPLPAPDLGADQVICEGDAAVTLDGGLFDSYLWSTGATSPTIDVSTTDEYILTVTDVNGCEASDTMNLTVNPLPAPDLGIDQEICEGDAAVTLDGGVFDSYLWSTGSTTPTIDVSTTDEFILTVTDVNGCESSDTLNLTVNPLPVVTLNDLITCPGSSVIFDAGVYDSYLWHDGSTNQTYNSSSEETVWVRVEDENGCIDRDTAEVEIRDELNVDLGDDETLCFGEDVVLDAGVFNNDTYLWNDGSGNQTLTVNSTGEYYVEVTDINGCRGFDTVNVLVNPLPTPDLGVDQEICLGDDAITLDGGLYDSYIWNTGETTPTIDVDATGEYILTVTDLNGCEASDTMEFLVNDLPEVTLNDQSVCPGIDANYDAGAFDGYLWHDNSTAQTYSTTIEETVWVRVEDENGCFASDTAEVDVRDNLEVNIGPDVTLCEGEEHTLDSDYSATDYTIDWSAVINGVQTNLTAGSTLDIDEPGSYRVMITDPDGCAGADTMDFDYNPNPIIDLGDDINVCSGVEVTLDAGIPANSYSWSLVGSSDELGSSLTYNPTQDGVYEVEVEDLNGCIGNDEISVSFIPDPVIQEIPDVIVCAGETAVLSPDLPSGDVLWNTGETTSTISSDTAGTFWVSVTNIANCSSSETFDVIWSQAPEFEIIGDTSICEGQTSEFSVQLDNNEVVVWSTGEISSTITVNNSGNYIATVTNVDDCSTEESRFLMVNPLPNYLKSKDTTLCLEEIDNFEISVTTQVRNDIQWDEDLSNTSILSITQPNLYPFSVTSSEGCVVRDTINIQQKCETKLFVPNALTPDGDGINDYFTAQGINVRDFEMYIFNRWGDEIFYTNDINKGWDGKYKGNVVQIDVYVYKIFYSEEQDNGGFAKRQMVGSVTVLR